METTDDCDDTEVYNYESYLCARSRLRVKYRRPILLKSNSF